MRTVTFSRGGVHPPERKISAGTPIRPLPMPDELVVPLNQHLGRPATCLVKTKENVRAGQKIGEADGLISAHVHSPASGTVKKVERRLSPMGMAEESVVISVDHEKTVADLARFEEARTKDPLAMSREALLEKIREAGVVGQGGATFPTHVKLSPPEGKPIDLLVVNGAECEPFLTADHRLMLESADALLSGIRIVMKILDVRRAVIGIEANKPDAMDVLSKKILENEMPVDIQPLRTRYPQGGEKQLIEAVSGRRVPSGKLPFEVGVVVQNVGTLVSIHDAVVYERPVIDRITTVTGEVKMPGNFRVPVGATFAHVINAAGGFSDPEHVGAIINGGPMMGKAVRRIDVPVVKGTSGVLVLSREMLSTEPEGPCIRCGRCVDVCAMGLVPTVLAQASRLRQPDDLSDVMDCMECGSCAYICPTNRRLVHWIRIGKAVYRNAKRR